MLNNDVEVRRVHIATDIDVSGLTIINLMVNNFKITQKLSLDKRLHMYDTGAISKNI